MISITVNGKRIEVSLANRVPVALIHTNAAMPAEYRATIVGEDGKTEWQSTFTYEDQGEALMSALERLDGVKVHSWHAQETDAVVWEDVVNYLWGRGYYFVCAPHLAEIVAEVVEAGIWELPDICDTHFYHRRMEAQND